MTDSQVAVRLIKGKCSAWQLNSGSFGRPFDHSALAGQDDPDVPLWPQGGRVTPLANLLSASLVARICGQVAWDRVFQPVSKLQ